MNTTYYRNKPTLQTGVRGVMNREGIGHPNTYQSILVCIFSLFYYLCTFLLLTNNEMEHKFSNLY